MMIVAFSSSANFYSMEGDLLMLELKEKSLNLMTHSESLIRKEKIN